jgi:ribokinase
MSKPCRICVVGSANVDLTFRTPRLPKPGETLGGQSLFMGMGGKGANQAVMAARLGAKVTFVARVGNDAFGLEALRHYQAEGIDTTFVRRDKDRSTGAAGIIVDDHAENCIIVVPGANAGLTPGDMVEASSAIQESDAVLCQLETPLDATLEAFRLARAAGVKTVLTPAPVQPISNEMFTLCDLCVPNKTEMEQLAACSIDSHADIHSAANLLRARGVRNIVVTIGDRGALLVNDAGAVHIPAVDLKAVDTTGAGDAFTAALAVSWAEGLELREAAQRASIVAALTVTRIGAQAAFPSLAEVNDWTASE